MIFELKFQDKTEFAQAKSQLHLLQEWNKEYDDFEDILEVRNISKKEAKTIMLKNNEYNDELPLSDENFEEFSLYEASCGEDFCVIGSTEWY